MADETYSGVRPMAVSAEGISFVKNIMAPTRAGTKLAMDIHVPAGEGPWPVIFTYIPYRKDARCVVQTPFITDLQNGNFRSWRWEPTSPNPAHPSLPFLELP